MADVRAGHKTVHRGSAGDVKIALISDTHLSARTVAVNLNFKTVAHWIEASDFDLVIHLGDVTADAIVDPGEFAEARELLSACRTPMRFVPGNHDIGDNPAWPGEKADKIPLNPRRLEQYREEFGPDRWSLAVDDWLLVGLNAQLLGSGMPAEEEQYNWLEGAVAGGHGPVALFLHKPLFRHGPADKTVDSLFTPPLPRRRLLDMLETRGLRLVVSGHVHQERRTTVEGIDHVWLPSAAFTFPDSRQETIGRKRVGAAALVLNGRSSEVTFERPEGLRDLELKVRPQTDPRKTRPRPELGADVAGSTDMQQ